MDTKKKTKTTKAKISKKTKKSSDPFARSDDESGKSEDDTLFKSESESESEEKVQNAIINLTKNKTTLVIAHRLSTIIRADKIFVLNQGKIADFGTHNELLKNSMIYKNLYSKQLTA